MQDLTLQECHYVLAGNQHRYTLLRVGIRQIHYQAHIN